jgi:hypothetical protein
MEQHFWRVIAKVVIIVFVTLLIIQGVRLLKRRERIYHFLRIEEHNASLARDDVMFGCTQLRAELDAVRERLGQINLPRAIEVKDQLMKLAGNAAWLLFQKEKNLFTWGMFGAKVGKSLFQFFMSRSKM